MPSIPEEIVQIGRWMFDRRLSDIAGGNISVRDGDLVYMTPTGAGQIYRWQVPPEAILVAPVESDDLMRNPLHSKEAISHLMVYRAYPQVNAIIHSHPFHVLPFCAAGKPIPAVILSSMVYGEVFEQIADKPLYSAEQGQEIVDRLRGKEAIMAHKAAALLMPLHGIFVAGTNLGTVIDCLERVDTNAYCVLAQKWLA